MSDLHTTPPDSSPALPSPVAAPIDAPAPRKAHPSRRRRRVQVLTYKLFPLAVFIGLVLIYNANGRFVAGSDVYSTRFMPVNLALNGSYFFDASKPYNLGMVVNDPASPSHGRMISVYPTYTPTLLSPIYYLIYNLGGVPPEHYLTFYLDKLFATLFAAGAGVFTFLLLRRLHGGRLGMPLLVTLAMALGTSLWAIASQGSWAHGPSAFYMIFSAWALECAVRHSRHGRPSARWAVLTGWAMASAFVTRQTDIFFVAPFFLFALWELRFSRRAAAAILAGMAPVVAWFLLHNWVHFGGPFTTGYKYNAAQQYIPHLIHPENFFAGFIGLFCSPSLGLFTMAPVTLFALPGMFSAMRARRRIIERRPDGSHIEQREPASFMQRLVRIGVVFIILHVVFYSCYLEWWGGWSYCYRYLIDIQPFVALCIGWFFRPGSKFLKLRWPLFVPALVFSILVQFYGVFFWSGVFYYRNLANSPRLYLDLSPKKDHSGIFNRASSHFSLNRRDHIILGELDWWHWDVTSWDDFWRPFATPRKIKKDLFETKTVNFKPSPPIILGYGE